MRGRRPQTDPVTSGQAPGKTPHMTLDEVPETGMVPA